MLILSCFWLARASGVPFPASSVHGPTETVELRGQPTVVNFWASWCAPCLAELPLFDQLSSRLVGLAKVVAISVDSQWGPAQGVVTRLRLTLPLAHDPTAALPRALDARGLPATYLLDADGNIVRAHFAALTAPEVATLESEVLGLVAR